MASSDYSFIDIAVHDDVRTRFAAGDALAVLSVDLDHVLWANGPGAELFGYPDIEAAIGAPSGLRATAKRQIMATRGFPRIARDRSIAVRPGEGFRSPLVTFLATGMTLPDGEPALLLAVPAEGAGADAVGETAERAISGFTEAGHFAALIDGDGNIAASTRGFGALDIDGDALRELVEEVSDESDRLVKRMISGAPRRLPAGIARLTDEPAMHFLVVVDEAVGRAPDQEAAEEDPVADAGMAAPEEDDRIETPGNMPEGARTLQDNEPAPVEPPPPAADSRHDHWYFTGPGASGHAELSAPREPARPENAAPDSTTAPVRFVWRTDAETRFTTISEDFINTVGPAAADVAGRRFRDVADVFGLDPEGDIAGLLERRDTWSGRTVLWPIAGTALKAPVDLAALPAYDRDRTFEGFRGFGIVRLGEAVPDPDAIGMALVAAPAETHEPVEDRHDEPSAPAGASPGSDVRDQAPDEGEDDPFRGEVPALATTTEDERRANDKVIRLAEHRTPTRRNELSPTEQTAFREIGDRLRLDEEQIRADADGGDREAAPDETVEIADETGPASADEAPGADAPETGTIAGADDIAAGAEPDVEAPPAPPGDDLMPATTEAVEDEAPVADVPAEAPVGEAPAEAPEDRAEVAAVRAGVLPSAFAGPVPDREQPGLDTAILAHLPVPILIHAGDVLHYANQEFLDLTGYADVSVLEEAGGLGAIFAEPYDDADGPEASGQTLRLRRPDGKEFPVEAHLQSVPWKAGKALLLALRRVAPVAEPEIVVPPEAPGDARADSAADIEEVETRLAEMKTIVDTATDGVVIIDNEGRIRSISRPAEALFGFDAEHVIGKPFASLFAIESQGAAQDYLNGLSDNGVASVLNDGREVIGREAQGRFIPLFMTMGRLPGESGFCAVVRDITQWKRAEEELTQARAQAERSSSQKTDFLARVSHEIRTPLNAIIGFSELMMDEKFGPIGNDRYRDYLRDINRSGNHVLDLVNDLLDISKIEAGEQEMHYEAVALNDTLAETVAMMQPQANRERVIIRSSFVSRLPDVVADLRSVRQIALNLLSNAIRYTPAGGQVIVSTAYETTGAVIMRVRDTGVGMSAVEIDQALKPFKQLNTLKRQRGDGTGLGLPLTRAMVEANRAKFTITSTPGAGTLVEVSFPPTRVLAE